MGPGREPPRLVFVYSAPLVKRCRRQEVVPLAQKKEKELILRKLRECGRRFRFRAEVATTFNLRKLLNTRCDMLHFSGHGDENFLAFESSLESECGFEDPIAVEPLKNMIQPGGVQTKLVVINSCCSELSGNAFVEAGVPHVVAVKQGEGITDQAARHFSELFYDALIEDGGTYTLREAFDNACNTVNTTHSDEQACEGNHFLLLPKDGDHDVRIFGALEEGELVDERPLPPRPASCKRGVASYKGLRELQKVIGLLVDTNAACVTVTGENGSGKTERAIQAFDYVRERHHFESYHWADCDKTVIEATDAAASVFPSEWSVDSVLEDPRRLIGIAIGMTPPGPASEEELLQFLFKNPMREGAPPCQKVLLVLENADSLLERGGNARDRLVTLLSDLCSAGGGRHLKLLVTSERRLQPGTDARFRSGSEVESKVQPLRRVDAAKLLVENLPRKLTTKDLNLPPSQAKGNLLQAVQEHPFLKEVLDRAEGHPGILLALAPKILDIHRCDLGEIVDTHRQNFRSKDYRLTRHRRGTSGSSALSTSWGAGSSGGFGRGPNSTGSVCTGNCRSPSGSPTAPLPFLRQAFSADVVFTPNHNHGGFPAHGMAISEGSPFQRYPSSGAGFLLGHGGSSYGGGRVDGMRITTPPLPTFAGAYAPEEASGAHFVSPTRCDRPCCQGQPSPPRLSPCCRRRQPQAAVDGHCVLPHLTAQDQSLWYRAMDMGVSDPGCRLVWVTAVANTAWQRGVGARGGGGGGSGGGGGGECFLGARQGQHNESVSWGCLEERLLEHLRGKLTVPARRRRNRRCRCDSFEEGYCRVVLDTEDEDEEEENDNDDDYDEWGGRGKWYGPINTPQPRVVDDAGLDFIRGCIRLRSDRPRAQAEVPPPNARSDNNYERDTPPVAGGLAEGEGGGGGDGSDLITLKAFVNFCRWWAPLVATVSRLRGDWESTDPVRIHGFIARFEAERQLLRQRRSGTFLFRFSSSMKGALILSFTEREAGNPRYLTVRNCVVRVCAEGSCTIDLGGITQTYAALHDLVRSSSRLKTLYPDIPKEEAFYLTPLSPNTGGRPTGREASDGEASAREARGVTKPVPIPGAAIRLATTAVVAPRSFGNSAHEAPATEEGRDGKEHYADADWSKPEEEGGGGRGGEEQ